MNTSSSSNSSSNSNSGSNSSSNSGSGSNSASNYGSNSGSVWENYPVNDVDDMPTAKNMERIGFHETQKHLLCGKHALNNVLQEEKFVWVNSPNSTIGGDNPLDEKTKINVLNSCKIYEEALSKKYINAAVEEGVVHIRQTLSDAIKPRRHDVNLYGAPRFGTKEKYQYAKNGFNRAKLEYVQLYNGLTDAQIKSMIRADYERDGYYIPDDEKCNTAVGQGDEGMLPINIFPKLLESLNYKYRIFTTDNSHANDHRSVQDRVMAVMDGELEDPLCLGAVLNVPDLGGHYTAIVKYRKNCLSITNATRVAHYIYADSLLSKSTLTELQKCKKIDDLKTYLNKSVVIRGAVFIYEKPGEVSYISQAQKNRDEINPLNRIQNAGRRKTRKSARKMKASRTRRH